MCNPNVKWSRLLWPHQAWPDGMLLSGASYAVGLDARAAHEDAPKRVPVESASS
jgi:hypothetical protein